jgi:hypothetical protein
MMGMSTHIVGFREPTQEHLEKVAAYKACELAEVDIPKKLQDYFRDTEPSEHGMEVDLEDSGSVSEHRSDCTDGFDVDLKKLPQGVTRIRFFNSY